MLTRAKRGLMVLRELKTKPHRVVFMDGEITSNNEYTIVAGNGETKVVRPMDLTLVDRTSNGSALLGDNDQEVKAVLANFDYSSLKEQ